MLHAAKDSLALPVKNHTKKCSQRQEVTKSTPEEELFFILMEKRSSGHRKDNFSITLQWEKPTVEKALYICKIEENIIFCRFSLGSRKPRPSGALKSSAILYICSARDWERSGLLGGIPRVVVQISALL